MKVRRSKPDKSGSGLAIVRSRQMSCLTTLLAPTSLLARDSDIVRRDSTDPRFSSLTSVIKFSNSGVYSAVALSRTLPSVTASQVKERIRHYFGAHSGTLTTTEFSGGTHISEWGVRILVIIISSSDNSILKERIAWKYAVGLEIQGLAETVQLRRCHCDVVKESECWASRAFSKLPLIPSLVFIGCVYFFYCQVVVITV